MAVEARDGRAFGGGGDAQIGEAGPVRQGRVAGGAEQRLVDERAGEGAELGAERRAGERGAEDREARRQERAADGGAGNGEGEGGHGGEVVRWGVGEWVGSGEWGVGSGE